MMMNAQSRTGVRNAYAVKENGYRFAFNGQEKTDEISGSGNHNTALYWEYDTRLGRRWNVDPVVKEFESPYATFANNSIWNIDLNGADTTNYINFKNSGFNERQKTEFIGNLKNIYSKAGLSVNFLETNMNYSEVKEHLNETDQFLGFENRGPLADPGRTIGTYQSLINVGSYKFQLSAFTGATRALANTGAHEVLHGYVDRAEAQFNIHLQDQFGLTPNEHLNPPAFKVNLMSDYSFRNPTISTSSDDWERQFGTSISSEKVNSIHVHLVSSFFRVHNQLRSTSEKLKSKQYFNFGFYPKPSSSFIQVIKR